jgi:hypothetical protein
MVPGAKGQDHEQFKEANHFIQEGHWRNYGLIECISLLLKIKYNEEKNL